MGLWSGTLGASYPRYVDSYYRKIPKLSPEGYIFQRPFLRRLFLEGFLFGGVFIRRGLSAEGNLRFKIDWASLIVGRKFTVFAFIYFVPEGNFKVQAPVGGSYLEGRFNGGFFALRVWGGGLIFRILRYTTTIVEMINNYEVGS